MTPVEGDERTDGPPYRRFRRMLVVFDPGFENLPAMDALAALAARMEADLQGLFVEDSDLLNLAGYPVTSPWGPLSRGPRTLDPSALRRAFRAQAASSRRAMERAAEAQRIRVSFEVREGRLATEVLASSQDADLVVVDWAAGGLSVRPGGAGGQPGAVARAVAEGAARSVLLLRHGSRLGGPVLAVYDGSEAADKALDIAGELADRDGGELEIILLTDRLSEAAAWRRRLDDRLAARGLALSYLQMPHMQLGVLSREARRRNASIMVVEAQLPVFNETTGQDLLAHTDCSVLLVR